MNNGVPIPTWIRTKNPGIPTTTWLAPAVKVTIFMSGKNWGPGATFRINPPVALPTMSARQITGKESHTKMLGGSMPKAIPQRFSKILPTDETRGHLHPHTHIVDGVGWEKMLWGLVARPGSLPHLYCLGGNHSIFVVRFPTSPSSPKVESTFLFVHPDVINTNSIISHLPKFPRPVEEVVARSSLLSIVGKGVL